MVLNRGGKLPRGEINKFTGIREPLCDVQNGNIDQKVYQYIHLLLQTIHYQGA